MHSNFSLTKNNWINSILVSFLVILFISLPLVKLFNSNASYFDLGTYSNKINNLQINKNIFLFHFEFCLLFIKQIVNILLTEKYFGYGLIILQSTILLIPIFFIKKKIILYSYLLNPIIWNLNIFDFHTESLGFVLIFFTFKFLLDNKDNYSNFFLFLLIFIKETFTMFIFLFVIFRFFERKKIDYWGIFILVVSTIIYIIFFIQNNNQVGNIYIENVLNLETKFKSILDTKIFIFFIIQLYLIILLPKKYVFRIILFFVIPQNLIFFKIAAYEQLSVLTHHYVYIIAPIISILIINSNKKIFSFLIILTLTLSSFPFSILSIGDFYKTSSIKNYLISSENFEFNSFLINNFESLNKSQVVADNNVMNNFIVSFENYNVFPSLKGYSNDIDQINSDLKNIDKVILMLKKNKDRYFLLDKIYDKKFYKNYQDIYLNHFYKILFENDKYIVYEIRIL